ncbi:phosphoglycerate kinase family protein, partial [Striga asiatica]
MAKVAGTDGRRLPDEAPVAGKWMRSGWLLAVGGENMPDCRPACRNSVEKSVHKLASKFTEITLFLKDDFLPEILARRAATVSSTPSARHEKNSYFSFSLPQTICREERITPERGTQKNEKLEGKTTPEALPRISHKIAVDDAREEEKFNSSTDEETKIWNLRHWEPIEASPSENCNYKFTCWFMLKAQFFMSGLTSDTLRQYDRMLLTDLLNSKVMVRREEERTSSFEAQIVPSSAIPDGWMGLDIGPDSIKSIQQINLKNIKQCVSR